MKSEQFRREASGKTGTRNSRIGLLGSLGQKCPRIPRSFLSKKYQSKPALTEVIRARFGFACLSVNFKLSRIDDHLSQAATNYNSGKSSNLLNILVNRETSSAGHNLMVDDTQQNYRSEKESVGSTSGLGDTLEKKRRSPRPETRSKRCTHLTYSDRILEMTVNEIHCDLKWRKN